MPFLCFGRFIHRLQRILQQRQFDEFLQLRRVERPLLDFLLDFRDDHAFRGYSMQLTIEPLLQKRLSGLGDDADAVDERGVGGFVDDEGGARKQSDPLRGDPLEERARLRAPGLRREQRGDGQKDAELRAHADVPVGVEVDAAAALAALAVLRQREEMKRRREIRFEGVSPVGESVEETRLETGLEERGGALEEDDFEDFPAAGEKGGFFWKFVEEIRLEEQTDEDFPR